jgi:hypothetical protein
MTDRQEDQMSMFRTLLAIRAIFAAAIAAIVDLDSDFDDFEAEVDAIKALLPKQKLQTTGIARDKQDVEDELVDMATIVSGAIMALASKAGNNTLFDEVKYSQSRLGHMRDEELPDICRIIYERGNTHAAALVSRGISAQMLIDFDGLITEYEGISEAPRTATTQKSTATTQMADHFTEALKIVKERLDGGMRIFKTTNEELYLTYRNGRKIVNTSGKKKDTDTGDLAFHVTDENNDPISGVVVSFDNRVSSTDDNGYGIIKGVSPGNKLVRFIKPEYEEQFVPATIQKDQVTTLNVQLAEVENVIEGSVPSPGIATADTTGFTITGATLLLLQALGTGLRFYFSDTQGGAPVPETIYVDVQDGQSANVTALQLGFGGANIHLCVQNIGMTPGTYSITVG